MTYVHFVQADGSPRRAHMHVPVKGRRRLSAVMREHALDTGRSEPMFVSVTRQNRLKKLDLGSFVDVISKPNAERQVLRKQWPKTVVGDNDVITITYLPLGGGGGGSQGGGRKSGVAIGASIAAILLSVVAPFAVPFIATGLGISSSIVGVAYAGVIIGLNYLASRAAQAKANKESDNRPLYGVSGGGNTPKAGDRIPVIYGQVWTTPALSQPDYSVYSGEDQVLFKRMTIGCGEYTLKAVRVGTQEVWRDGAYLNGLGAAVQLEYVAPGGLSTVAPSSVTSSPDVAGIELPRPGSSPEWAGPFTISAPGVEVTILQFNMVCSGGVFAMGPTGSKFAGTSYPTVAHPYIQYALADGSGNPVGGWTEVPATAIEANSQKPVRRTFTVTVPKGRYVVRAKNLAAEIPSNQSGANGVTWDFAGGYIPEVQVRPGISEIAMQIKAGPGLSLTQFGQIECLVQRKLPVYRSGSFTVQESSKALDAFVDIAMNEDYGAGMPAELLDLNKISAYLTSLTTFDTFNGQLNGPVSVWDAWSVVLGPMRAEPVLRGAILSFQRDEQQTIRRHHFTRRQILSKSSAAEISLNRGEGTASIRSEFFTGGDPRRRNEVSATYGPEPLASTLVNFEGVVDHEHATHLARWTAAANFYRREIRRFRIELLHRALLPGDMIGVDLWFFSKGISLGLGDLISGTRYQLEGDAVWPSTKPSPLYAFIIDREGKEFGPIGCTVDDSAGWIEFNSSDISAAEASAGKTLAQAIQPEDGGSTTHLRIGTLNEITENFIVRSVKPIDAFRADVEVINDAPEVWAAIGETYTPPGGLYEPEITDPPIPKVRWVSAVVTQVQQSLICHWSVSQARGAIGYVIEVSRDDKATWGEISSGPATTGDFAIEHREDAVNWIRARAWGAGGFGPWKEAPFSTSQEGVVGTLADELEDLFARARASIAAVAAIGEGTIRDALKKLSDKVDQLALDAATEAGNSFERREFIKVQVDESFAAIEREVLARVTESEATAAIIDALGVRLTDTENDRAADAIAISELSTTVTLQGETLTSQSASITSLGSRMTTAEGNITGTATAVSSLTTTVSSQGSTISSQATQISALNTSVAGNTATLTTYGTSIDGLSVKFGVTGSINGVTGGFVFSGIQKLDGTVSYGVEIVGNLVVDGTISGQKLQAYDIIANSAQIGSLVVDNISIKNGAVSNSAAVASGGTSAATGLSTRSTSKVSCSAVFNGAAGTYWPLGTSPGQLRIFRDGTLLAAIPTSFEASGSGPSAGIALLATPALVLDAPGAGFPIYTVDTTNAAFVGGVTLIVTELSK